MNGTKLPESIKELSNKKDEVTLFVDGDRGGNLIIKNVTENAKVDFIAMAPEGKEVEELTQKEILQAIRKKIPVKEYSREQRSRGVKRYDRDREKDRDSEPKKETKTSIKKITSKEKEEIKSRVSDLVGTKAALVFNKDLEVIRKTPVAKLSSLRTDKEPYVIAIDGTATPKVIETCENLGCDNLIATNFVNTDTNINLVSL